MFRKMLLATSALVVASSMALAATQHGRLSPTEQAAKARLVTRHAFMTHMPGVIFDRRHGTPMAIRFPVARTQSGVLDGAEDSEGKLAPHRNGFSNFSRSKNALFLIWFGWFAGHTSVSYNSSFSYCISYNSNYTQCLNREHIHYSSQITLTQSAAQPFTHVSTASSISLGVGPYSGTGPFKAGIYKDSSGLPGKPVEGASGTFTPVSTHGICCEATTVTFAPVSLHKDKQYWVVVNKGSTTNGRLIWFGQDGNFAHPSTGEDYNALEHVKYKDTYRTTRSGRQSTYSASYSTGTGGWINTSGYSFAEQNAAFSINIFPR